MPLITRLLAFLGIPSETPSQRRRRRAAEIAAKDQAPAAPPTPIPAAVQIPIRVEVTTEYRVNPETRSDDLRPVKFWRTKEEERLVESVLNWPADSWDNARSDHPDEHWQQLWDDKVQQARWVVLPPSDWQLSGRVRDVWADADWTFPLAAKSEEEWQLYVYSVKDFPELLKIGIAKDAVKRKEPYYKKKLALFKLPKRDAILAEHLFKHSTYHRANVGLPPFNVGNMVEENLIPEIREFMEVHQGSGMTEIRKMDLEEAKATIAQIMQDLRFYLRVDQLALKYGIKTFLSETVGRSQMKLPHKWWRTTLSDREEYDIEFEAEHYGKAKAKTLEARLRAALWDGVIEQGWQD